MMDRGWVTLDRESRQAFYRQIAAALRGAIESGALGPGDRLPPARELAGQLGVNFNTVARAYRLLAERGYAEPRPGRGTRVSEPPAEAGTSQLEVETLAFLGRLHGLGYTPQDVRWEFAAAIRAWIQEGEPPPVP